MQAAIHIAAPKDTDTTTITTNIYIYIVICEHEWIQIESEIGRQSKGLNIRKFGYDKIERRTNQEGRRKCRLNREIEGTREYGVTVSVM